MENERQVILEEISRKFDNPFGYLFDETIPTLFTGGPYTHPVIGSRESVKAISREDLHAHYRRYYAPENMFLNIVGNVDPEETRRLVEEAFKDFQRPLDPWENARDESEFAPPQDRTLVQDWNEAYFILAFPGPPADDLETVVRAELLEMLLAGGRSSRLVNSLQEKKGLVSNIGAFFMTNRHAGPLLIFGTCKPEDLDEVKQEIFAELRALADDGFNGREEDRVRRMVMNSHLFSMETNAGRASTMGYSRVLLGDLSMVKEYDEQVHEISRNDLLQFVEQYLREDTASFLVTRREGNGSSS